MTDLLLTLLKANLAASVLILAVFAVRRPVRGAFGARVAYGLWCLPVLGAAAVMLPARMAPPVETAPAASQAFEVLLQAPAVAPSLDLWAIASVLWIAGVAVSVVWLGLRQAHFQQYVRRGSAGPAVVGFLRPRVVLPSDFDARFDAAERQVVLAHEGAHLKRQDARIVAVAVLARCLNWFNPLVHLAVFQLRIDQELACDEAVLAANPGVARAYAETMLKAQLTAHPLPLGCAWPSGTLHPLAERIALLGERRPSRQRILAGGSLVAVLAISCGAIAWAAQPPRPAPLTPREGNDASRATAASQLLAQAVPQTPEGETMKTSQRTPGQAGRLAGAAVVAAIGLGTGSASVAAPAPEPQQLTNSQPAPAAAAPAEGRTLITQNGRRTAGDPNDPAVIARTAALASALGLPAGTNVGVNCAVSGAIGPAGAGPATSNCRYSTSSGASGVVPPETMQRLRAEGLFPAVSTIDIQRRLQGE